jgi:hypothetical protein
MSKVSTSSDDYLEDILSEKYSDEKVEKRKAAREGILSKEASREKYIKSQKKKDPGFQNNPFHKFNAGKKSLRKHRKSKKARKTRRRH